MQSQLQALVEKSGFPLPTFLSLISPLVGTAAFWEDAGRGDLAPNMLLRDLDGGTIAYSRLADRKENLAAFIDKMSQRPWSLVDRRKVILSMLKRLTHSSRIDPLRWYVVLSSSLYNYAFGGEMKSTRKTYMAGEDLLDPQYFEYPPDISRHEKAMYFDPIAVTKSDGSLSDWLLPYAKTKMSVSANQDRVL